MIDIAADPNYGNRLCAIIVENTFTSIPHIAKHLISFIKYIPLICHKNRVGWYKYIIMICCSLLIDFYYFPSFQFASIDKVDKITAPALFISGLNDLLVPPAMMSTLHSHSKSRKQLFQLAGGGHMDTFLISGWVEGA